MTKSLDAVQLALANMDAAFGAAPPDSSGV